MRRSMQTTFKHLFPSGTVFIHLILFYTFSAVVITEAADRLTPRRHLKRFKTFFAPFNTLLRESGALKVFLSEGARTLRCMRLHNQLGHTHPSSMQFFRHFQHATFRHSLKRHPATWAPPHAIGTARAPHAHRGGTS